MELWGWGGRKDGLCRKEVWGRSEVGAPQAGPPEGVGQSGELPVPALVEVVVRDELGVGGVVLGGLVDAVGDRGRVHLFTPLAGMELAEIELSLGRPPGGMNERRRGGLTDVGEDAGDGLRLSEERDEREGGPAGGANQREDLVDSGQKGGPRGGSGGAWVGWLGFRVPGFGRRGRRGQGRWEREIRNGILDGVGMVLVGPSRDEGPQGGIGYEDPVVAVAMNPGRGKDGGETVQELQRREAERRSAVQIGPRQNVEHLVGAVANEVEAAKGERGPGAISDQALEAGAVGGLDTDRGVEAKSTAVVPGEHVVCLVGLQKTLAAEVTKDPLSDRMLEALQELGGEIGGFVEL